MAKSVIPNDMITGGDILDIFKKKNGGKAVIVVERGNSVRNKAELNHIQNYLLDTSVEFATFDRLETEPRVETVLEGIEFIHQERPDIIIGLGNNSIVEAAKVMWVYYEYPNADLEGSIEPLERMVTGNMATFVALPGMRKKDKKILRFSDSASSKNVLQYSYDSFKSGAELFNVENNNNESNSHPNALGLNMESLDNRVNANFCCIA